MIKTIDNSTRKTVLKNKKRINFDKLQHNDIIQIGKKDTRRWRVLSNPCSSIHLRGVLEVDLLEMRN